MPSAECVGYVVGNQLRNGLAGKCPSLLAAGGVCSAKTKG